MCDSPTKTGVSRECRSEITALEVTDARNMILLDASGFSRFPANQNLLFLMGFSA
jgi:hypothetical protein